MSKRPCDFDESSVAKRAKDMKGVEDAKDAKAAEDLNIEDEATKAIRDIVLNVATIGYDFSIVNWIDENPCAWKPHAENVFVNWLRVRATLGSVLVENKKHGIDELQIGTLEKREFVTDLVGDFDKMGPKFDKWALTAFERADIKAYLMNELTEKDGKWTGEVAFTIYLIDDAKRLLTQVEADGFGFSKKAHDIFNFNSAIATINCDYDYDVMYTIVKSTSPLTDPIKEALLERALHYNLCEECNTFEVHVYWK